MIGYTKEKKRKNASDQKDASPRTIEMFSETKCGPRWALWGAVVNGFPFQAAPHRPRIPEAPARGWLSEQSPAIKQDHKCKAGELNNVGFTTPGDENGIYRLGDMFEAARPGG